MAHKNESLSYDSLNEKVQKTLNEYTPEKEEVALDDTTRIKVLSPGQLVFKRFIRSKLSVIGMAVLLFMFLLCFLGPLFSPYGEAELFYRYESVYSKQATIIVNDETNNNADFNIYAFNSTSEPDAILSGKMKSASKRLYLSYLADSTKTSASFTYSDSEYLLEVLGDNLVRINKTGDNYYDLYTYSNLYKTNGIISQNTPSGDRLSYKASESEDSTLSSNLLTYINTLSELTSEEKSKYNNSSTRAEVVASILSRTGKYTLDYNGITYIINLKVSEYSSAKFTGFSFDADIYPEGTVNANYFATTNTVNKTVGSLASNINNRDEAFYEEVSKIYFILEANATAKKTGHSTSFALNKETYSISDNTVTKDGSTVYYVSNMKINDQTGKDDFTLSFKKAVFSEIQSYKNGSASTETKDSDYYINPILNWTSLTTGGVYIKNYLTVYKMNNIASLIIKESEIEEAKKNKKEYLLVGSTTENYPIYGSISEIGTNYVMIDEGDGAKDITVKVYVGSSLSNYAVNDFVYAYGTIAIEDEKYVLKSGNILGDIDKITSFGTINDASPSAISSIANLAVGAKNTYNPIQGNIKEIAPDKSYLIITDDSLEDLKVYSSTITDSLQVNDTVYVMGTVKKEEGVKVLSNAYIDKTFMIHDTNAISGTINSITDVLEEENVTDTLIVVTDSASNTQVTIHSKGAGAIYSVGQTILVEGTLENVEGSMQYTSATIYDPNANEISEKGVDYYITLSDGVHGEQYFLKSDVVKRLISTYESPSLKHLLGTDAQGMDVFTRLMLGGRISLTIGFVVIFFENILGIFFGGIAGYFGGWVDNLIMRIIDIFNCLPFMPIVIMLGSLMDFARVSPVLRVFYLMIILGVLGWGGVARLVRGQILFLREQEFMVAAEATGLSVKRKIFKHLVPNVFPQLIVSATMGLGSVILTESTLSYLGLGVKYPTATWGAMINAISDAYALQHYTFVWVPIGLCIMITVIAFNIVGDGLRDAFDPRMKR